jgi:hypothetical protein
MDTDACLPPTTTFGSGLRVVDDLIVVLFVVNNATALLNFVLLYKILMTCASILLLQVTVPVMALPAEDGQTGDVHSMSVTSQMRSS